MTISLTSYGPVLLVEDHENDVLLLKHAFSKLASHIPLLVFKDGQAAWDYLVGTHSTRGDRRPVLVLLDLKLPKKSGHEILSALRGTPELRKVPVIVMTSSKERSDIDRAYASGADFYLVKPVDSARLLEMAEAIHAHWVAVCSDPDHVGADPTLSRLRKMAEPASLTG